MEILIYIYNRITALDAVAQQSPTGRLTTPEDVAAFADPFTKGKLLVHLKLPSWEGVLLS